MRGNTHWTKSKIVMNMEDFAVGIAPKKYEIKLKDLKRLGLKANLLNLTDRLTKLSKLFMLDPLDPSQVDEALH
jgi:hypothetical protein